MHFQPQHKELHIRTKRIMNHRQQSMYMTVRGEYMNVNHSNYLKYEIPSNWVVEEDSDTTLICDNNGEGSTTISFYTVMELQKSLDEHISIMAKKFIENNNIKLHNPLILDGTKKSKTVLYGTGTTSDNWFVKIWIVAKLPKIVFATYQSEKKTSEVKKVDRIIDSFQFIM